MSLLLSDDFFYFYFLGFSVARLCEGRQRQKMKRNRNIEDDPNFTFNAVFSSLCSKFIHDFRQLYEKAHCFPPAHTHMFSRHVNENCRKSGRKRCIERCMLNAFLRVKTVAANLHLHSTRPQQLCSGRLNSHMAAMRN